MSTSEAINTSGANEYYWGNECYGGNEYYGDKRDEGVKGQPIRYIVKKIKSNPKNKRASLLALKI